MGIDYIMCVCLMCHCVAVPPPPPPSVAVTRVATFKQLDSDLHKHAGLFTLVRDIPLLQEHYTLTTEIAPSQLYQFPYNYYTS